MAHNRRLTGILYRSVPSYYPETNHERPEKTGNSTILLAQFLLHVLLLVFVKQQRRFNYILPKIP